MNLQHVNVKLFVEGELSTNLDDIVKVFHRWVSEQSLPEMMIDVADYQHVPAGPSVLLVGLEADYSIDYARNRCGMRYNRKGVLEGSNADQFRNAFACAGNVCSQLEAEFDGLRFSRCEFLVTVNDRAIAPNNDETRAAFQRELESWLREDLGQNEFSLELETDPRQLVGAMVKLVTNAELPTLTRA